MKDRSGVYAAIAVLSFIMMAVSLAWAYANAGEGGVGLGELLPLHWPGGLVLGEYCALEAE